MTLLNYLISPLFNILARCTCYMYRPGHARQNELNDIHLQQANGKVPPSWDPSSDRHYPFRHYVTDVRLWSAATDLPEARQGAAAALRLTGAAKLLVREFDPQTLVNGMDVLDPAGGFDQNGNPAIIHLNGLDVLLRELSNRYAPLEQETQIHAISELFAFKRMQGENTDDLISRYVIVHARAQVQLNNAPLPPAVQSWMILTALHFPREKWTVLLAPTQGMLPQNAQQFAAFQLYLRRQGHLTDNGDSMKTLHAPYYGVESHEQQSYWQHQHTEHEPQYNTYEASNMFFPTFDADSSVYFADNDVESSAWSNNSEPVDLTDVLSLPVNLAGEQLYLQYRNTKRRFRRFTGAFAGSRSKGKGKRSGKGKGGKSKGKSSHFWNAQTQSFEDANAPTYAVSDEVEWVWDESSQVYFKGKGKSKGMGSGKGSGMKENPTGPDGKIMLCSLCGSKYHFRAHCTQVATSHSAPSGKGSSSKSSNSGFHVQSSPQSQAPAFPGYVPTYFAETPAAAIIAPDGSSVITYSDGSSEVLNPPTSKSKLPGLLAFVWFLPSASVFHATVRLPGKVREGLLVDCGALDNLSGEEWAARVESQATRAGQGSTWTAIDTLSVEGVGSGESHINSKVVLPIKLQNGDQSTFTTNIVSKSPIPGLLGLRSLVANQALIDTYNRRLIYPGPGGYKLQLSPGSRSMPLETAMSGHLLLPCTEWGTDATPPTGQRITF